MNRRQSKKANSARRREGRDPGSDASRTEQEVLDSRLREKEQIDWPGGPIEASNLSLHDLFQQQARQILDDSDLSEEQKQNVLLSLSCPCCGGGALSFTAKIRRRS